MIVVYSRDAGSLISQNRDDGESNPDGGLVTAFFVRFHMRLIAHKRNRDVANIAMNSRIF